MREVSEQIGDRRLTPMLKQYVAAKQDCPAHAILLFRMGDFYELFFDDARTAARELGINLTSRDKDTTDPIPMAGVPHHAISGYIAKLVARGYTVAICDQVEDPKQAKGIVERQVTRVVTPGTVSDIDSLDPGSAQFLAHVTAASPSTVNGDPEPEQMIVALLDMLAGEILCTRCRPDAVSDELLRMGVREVLVDPSTHGWLAACFEAGTIHITEFDEASALSDIMGEEGDTTALDELFTRRFGSIEIQGASAEDLSAERRAIIALLRYAEATQRRSLKHCQQPRAYQISDYLVVDESTRRNLELTRSMRDNRKQGSLLWHLDRCRTAMGSRVLSQWLLFPLRDPTAIERRLDIVEALYGVRSLRKNAQTALDGVRDIERLMGKVAVGRGTPRDLAALRGSLLAVPAMRDVFAEHESPLAQRWKTIDDVGDLRDLLCTALVEDPPLSSLDGGIFALGYTDELDELISVSTEGHGYLADLERRERERTKIPTLKVRFNKVFGYYIEVTKAHSDKVPADFVRKQTLVNAERFITDELKGYETKVLGSDERRKGREHQLFEALIADIAKHANRLRDLSRLIAETDAFISLAQVAEESSYCRPTFTDEGVLELVEGRHPVVERLMPGGERFVPNDVKLDTQTRQLVIVTGPNMSGKSTVMRQVALCTVMAQMGSFVPARRAHIGLCDRVFTRVGASDNLGRGQSTFMVEMAETATILRDATKSSLLLLDEIGRGTSTFDGVSIAWAVAEHLHDEIGCRAMFATHYHELTDLALERPRIVNVSIAVQEQDGRVVFLRRLIDGAANRSYGIQVASLAGLPEAVLERAREILGNLERGELDDRGMPRLAKTRAGAFDVAQLGLFGESASTPRKGSRSRRAAAAAVAVTPSPVEAKLSAIDPMNLTPLQALEKLDELRGMIEP